MKKRWALAPLVAAAAVLVLGMARGESGISNWRSLKKSRDVLQTTVDGIKDENRTLQDEIMRLKESPSYARKVLRDKYHVTDEGEDIVFFPE